MQTIPAAVLDDLAPQGVLRAAINYGNPVLAQAGAGGKPQGASVELAAALAQELGVALELVTYDAAGKVFADLDSGAWNLAFMAIEPVRAAQIAFSEPYVIIEGTYLVANDAPYFEVAQLDRPEVRIAVGQGAAYDLFLSRTLQQAQLVRAATSAEAIALFFERGLEAGGGGGPPRGGGPPAAAHPGNRVLEGHFTAIRQAMAVPRQKTQGAAYVNDFIERCKANGLVKAALQRSGQGEVTVAPPAASA
ncbi:transporter substrate-binding domain-containing protein [Serratia sp. IR-2025]